MLDWLLPAGAGIGAGVLGTLLALRSRPTAPTPAEDRAEKDADAERRAPSDRIFVRLVRALPYGVIVLDAASRITFANPAAGTIFAFDDERAKGKHAIQALQNVELERRIAEALHGEGSVTTVMLAGTRGQRAYRVAVYPLAQAPGEESALLLVDDQTDLVSLDRARKEFLSSVSHELRTPLASIKLMLETVLGSPDEEAGDLFLPQALAQVDRLADLVQQLLEQARTESGQLRLELREVDLEAVARPIVASFEPVAANKGVELDLHVLRPVVVEADPARISQVFVNLIDNALRHTPEGGRVKISIDAQGAEAQVSVRDTGEGIRYRDLPHIFERFYVVDRSRTRETGGAGLGLAIGKGSVDAHGGSIAAESMLGRGATFTVRLPIMRVRMGSTES